MTSATTVDPVRKDEPMSPRAIALVVALGVGLIFVVQLLSFNASTPRTVDAGGAWHPPSSRAEQLVAKMDGHAFAQIASDPLMRRTVDDFHGDVGAAAYRASRPLPGWMFAVGSLGGQRVLLAPAMLVLTAVTIGWAIFSVDVLGRSLGLRVRYLGALVLTPAMVASIAYPGLGDPLAIALSMTALAAWFRGRVWWAVGLFAASGLCRETALLVPLGLALQVIWERRSLRPALPLALAPLPYVAWMAVVRARIGAPDGGGQLTAPFAGLLEVLPTWDAAEYLTVALLTASTVVIFWRGYGWMKTIAALNVALATLMGPLVWFRWWGFGRVLTILPVLALVALSRPTAENDDDDARGPVAVESDVARAGRT
jgi:hypothetical protein